MVEGRIFPNCPEKRAMLDELIRRGVSYSVPISLVTAEGLQPPAVDETGTRLAHANQR
jgi:hypothetical protein